MRIIAAVTGTRAEYGLSRTIFEAVHYHPGLSLRLIVTGMHLMEEFGYSCRLIEQDGYPVAFKTGVTQEGDSGYDMAQALGKNVLAIAGALREIKPDIFLTLTDLGHTLAGAIAAAHLNIPVAHVHGGDVSGSIDEMIRHATTRFAHIHFPGSEQSAQRLEKMGEAPWRIFRVGAPGIDEIRKNPLEDKAILMQRYHLPDDQDYILVVQHPVTTEEGVRQQIGETIAGIKALRMNTILIYPNADSGGRAIIEEYRLLRGEPYVQMHKNLPRRDYLNLLRYAACMVGNSSSAIIEAPYFKVPAVNIGTRQRRRERAGNVIDVGYDRREIVGAVQTAMSPGFRKRLARVKSPYGDGHAGEEIAGTLAEIEINERLLNKELTY